MFYAATCFYVRKKIEFAVECFGFRHKISLDKYQFKHATQIYHYFDDSNPNEIPLGTFD